MRSQLSGRLLLLSVFGTLVSGPSAAQAPAVDAVLPVSAELCADMRAHRVLKPGAPVGCDRLRLVRFRYVDFGNKVHEDGELVVLDAVADRVLKIFVELHRRRFPISSAKLMNTFDGDDDASMDQNNTSAFNVRPIAGGRSMSPHAYAIAIDLNPVQNPYLRRSGSNVAVSPREGEQYLDRARKRPGMAEEVVGLFAENGFRVWGGHWHNPIDYQHFQLDRKLTDQLIHAPFKEARAIFEAEIRRYGCGQKPGAGCKNESNEPPADQNNEPDDKKNGDQTKSRSQQPSEKTEQPKPLIDQPSNKNERPGPNVDQPGDKNEQPGPNIDHPGGNNDQPKPKTDQSGGNNDQPKVKADQPDAKKKPEKPKKNNPPVNRKDQPKDRSGLEKMIENLGFKTPSPGKN